MASNAFSSDEILVNTVVAGDQQMSAVVALADGGWLVSWEGSGTEDADGIYQRHFDSSGIAVGAATLVNTPSTNDQFATAVGALKNGGWLVTWTGQGANFTNDIYLKSYDRDGNTVLAETVVNSAVTNGQDSSTVTALAKGGWVVTWSGEGAGDTYGIFQRRYDGNGLTDGADILVNSTYTTGGQYNSSVMSLADGGWVVGWYGEGEGDANGIFQQRYGADGVAAGGASLVNTYTNLNQYSPSMAALDDKGWIVTWSGYGDGDSDSLGVYLRRYDSNGEAVDTAQTLVNTVTKGTQTGASVTALADGGWLVTWQSPDVNKQTVYDIYQQRYDDDGDTVGSQTLVNVSTNADQDLPKVTAFANGGWLITWHGAGVGDKNGIYQRHFAADVVGGANADKLSGTAWDELLSGNAGKDKIVAREGDDVLAGGKGDDKLIGGEGADTFAFKKGDGADVITDFVAKGADHDLIDLSQVKGIDSYADLKPHIEQDGTSVTIDYTAHDTITLAGVTAKSLSAADFLF